MSFFVLRSLTLPPIDRREVLRYAGVRGEDRASEALLSDCIKEAEGLISPAVCHTELPLEIADDICTLGSLKIKSRSLAKSLSGAEKALVFAATVGVGLDRLVSRHNKISPSKALLLSSLGTERTEALCDAFLSEYKEKNRVTLTERFSPGYGDLPLSVQREIFALLDPYKNIGVALGGSLLMTPAKSVTAFVGII